jgi:hypothetical protein
METSSSTSAKTSVRETIDVFMDTHSRGKIMPERNFDFEKDTKCPICGNRIDTYFNKDQSKYNYECRKDDGDCGWISETRETK